jgi:hypothetical protein
MSTHPMKRFGKEGSSENSLHSAGVLNCGGTTSCLKDLLKDAAHLPPHSATFWHLMSVDAVGVSHEGIPRYIGSPLPSMSHLFYLGGFYDGSIVGGSMHSVQKGTVVAAAAAA